MQNRNSFPRFFLVLSLLSGLCAGLFALRLGRVEAKPLAVNAANIVISEFRTRGPLGGFDEFIEIFNPTNSSIDISGWRIDKSGACPSVSTTTLITIPSLAVLQPGQHYLVTSSTSTDVSLANQTYPANTTYAVADTGGIALFDLSNLVDSVGMCNTTVYFEGTTLSALSGTANQSYERKVGGTSGSCLDDGNNATDFALRNPSNPQNFSSPFTTCGYTPLSILINEVAWAGTSANEGHEWIELYNPGSTSIDLDTGWRLVSSDGSPNIDFSTETCSTPNCTIPAGGFFLLERDTEGVTNIIADLVYTGALANGGETLTLYSPSNDVIDTANGNGGTWPAGNTTTFSTMERIGTLPDSASAWFTNDGVMKNGLDYNEDPILGTPKNGNSPTPTPTATITSSPTNTFTPTPTLTFTPSITPTPAGLRSVIINEIAWAGTVSGLSNDEWIELYNPGNTPVDISGWSLSTGDGDPDIVIPPGISIPAGGYYLLERDDDNTVSDVAADQIYTGTLSNSGEALTLYDGSNKIIDTANGNGGSWPAGSSSTYGTMERNSGTADSDSAWHTNSGAKKNGKNANGGDILGTPKNSNSPWSTPTPTRTATPVRTPTPTPYVIAPRPIINEILPRPGFDWNQDGRVDVFDEFIEIKNLTAIDINLKGWKLDDEANIGSSPYALPDITLKPGQRRVFYGSQTNILLSDGGDSVRLINPNGKIYDAYTYSIAKKADQSICRLPDGNVHGAWYEDCAPTPNLTNTREGVVPSVPGVHYDPPVCELPDTLPADFFFAECHGYGENIWNPFFWDQSGWQGSQTIPQNMSKWEAYIR